jgi:TM2 domain-containing membrane protein YozV
VADPSDDRPDAPPAGWAPSEPPTPQGDPQVPAPPPEGAPAPPVPPAEPGYAPPAAQPPPPGPPAGGYAEGTYAPGGYPPGSYPPGGYPPAGYPPGGYQAPPVGYGYPAAYAYGPDPYAKSKIAAGLLGIFLGGFGIHRFYLGYTTIGIVQIIVTVLTCGLGAIWGLVEGIMILTGAEQFRADAEGRPLRE